MSKIIGFRLQQETRKLIDKFEDEVLIRFNNQHLLGTVYVDMQEDRWSVAFAYNFSRLPGIHGRENPLEVRYLCTAREKPGVRMFRSDRDTEQLLDSGEFPDGDAFIRFAVAQERALVGSTA
jgi:hypothetical protein